MVFRGSVLVVLLAACIPMLAFTSGQGEAQPADEEIVLTFAYGLDPGGAMEELARQYTEMTPGVTIEPLLLPSTPTQQYDRYVTTFAAQDDSIDVITTDIIWVPQFAAAGWIENIQDQVSAETVNELLEGPVNANRYRGDLFGLPLFTDTGLLYYRSDLLEEYGFEPPTTWEELTMQSQTILEGEQNDTLTGLVFQAAQIEGITINFLEFFVGAGGRFLDDQGDYVFPEYRDEARRALAYMHDVIHETGVAPTSVTTANPNDNRITFQQGNAIFMRNWPFAWGSLQDPEESEVAGAVGIAPIPRFSGHEDRDSANLGGWQLTVSSFSDEKEAALDFIQWAVGEDAQRILAIQGAQLPVRRSLYDDPEVRSQNELYEDIAQILERTFPRPVTEFYTEVSGVMQPELNAAVSEVKSVDEALDDMYTAIGGVLEE